MNYTEKNIDKAIAQVGLETAKLRNKEHNLAYSILFLWSKSNDVRPAVRRFNELYDGMDDYKKQSMMKWISAFAGFIFDDEEGVFLQPKSGTFDGDLQKAKATPYWKFSPPAPVKALDLPAAIRQLLVRVDSKMSNPDKRHDEDNIPQDTVDALRALTV